MGDIENRDARDKKIEVEILQAVKDINYGSVEIIIHDSRVVQIERKEKLRFDKVDSQKGGKVAKRRN